jgi:hypothetical protein
MPKRVYSRAYASIRFVGRTLDPLNVTKSLRLPPDHQHRGGEPRLTRSRNGGVQEYEDYREGLWSMSSKEWVESPVLETHVDWLLCQIEPLADAVRGLIAEGVNVDVFCYSLGRSKDSPSLSRATRERAESLGISIEIDHYVE